jgi:hypothetical protein
MMTTKRQDYLGLATEGKHAEDELAAFARKGKSKKADNSANQARQAHHAQTLAAKRGADTEMNDGRT